MWHAAAASSNTIAFSFLNCYFVPGVVVPGVVAPGVVVPGVVVPGVVVPRVVVLSSFFSVMYGFS